MRCLVTGATGYVGGRLVPGLLDRGYDVRAMARNPDKLAGVPWRDSVEVIRGDLGDPDSLVRAFTDVDVVYYLVHSMGTSKDFSAEERRSADNVVAAARRAGVRRLIYLGGLHPSGVRLSPHLRSRTAVGEILLSSGIETVVLQAGVIVGSGSASFEMIRHLTDRLPAMTTPKWVHNRIAPIAVGDALHYLVEAATAEVPESRTWDIGGPDVLEYGDMMQIYADVAGLRRRYIVVLPFLTPTIASLWVGLVTPIPAGLARPLIESLHCHAVMNDHDIDAVIRRPAAGLTDYRTAVSLALQHIGRGQADTSAQGSPSEPLPNDPHWAGEAVYVDERSTVTNADPDDVWAVVKAIAAEELWPMQVGEGQHLRVQLPGRTPGQAWLDVHVTPQPDGTTRYDQRMTFFPRGLAGRAYWYASLPLRRITLRRNAVEVHARAGGARPARLE